MSITPETTSNAAGDYFICNRRCADCRLFTLYLRIAADGARSTVCKSKFCR